MRKILPVDSYDFEERECQSRSLFLCWIADWGEREKEGNVRRKERKKARKEVKERRKEARKEGK